MKDKTTKRPWTHENDCILNHPTTGRPIIGHRIFRGGFLLGEWYFMDDEERDNALNAINNHERLVDMLQSCLNELKDPLSDSARKLVIPIVENTLKQAKGEI